MKPALEHRSMKAPPRDGQALIHPPWESLPDVVRNNRARLAGFDFELQGRPFLELARKARRDVLERAEHATRQYRDLPDGVLSSLEIDLPPVFLAGHQPTLFHPGVWYKNFALAALARQMRATPLFLVIDSDLCRSTSIRVPTGSVDNPRSEAVPFDQAGDAVPFEARRIRDDATFASFADRVATCIAPYVQSPLVTSFWPHVLDRHAAQTNLGACLAQGRHAFEAAWTSDSPLADWATLELPQSAVCDTSEFHWFVCDVLFRLPEFHAAYNRALAEYRAAHHLRNRAHPASDLAENDGWQETPFWIWSEDNPTRRPLFARRRDGQVLLTDTAGAQFVLPIDANRGADRLDRLAASGVKIRSRALATTLFARLFLGDIFLHGIGGAKYDEVTNAIAREYFGVELPQLAAASATLRLPIPHPPVDASAVRDIDRRLRELTYHPENYLSEDGSARTSRAEELVARKRHWIATPKTSDNAKRRHDGIVEANRALQAFVAGQRDALCDRRAGAIKQARANAILDSREYAFCLFPPAHLRPLLLDSWPATP